MSHDKATDTLKSLETNDLEHARRWIKCYAIQENMVKRSKYYENFSETVWLHVESGQIRNAR